MASSSHDLYGLILHDHFGSHLNATGKTNDSELEKVNFRKAGENLAEVWSQAIINGFSVHARYVDPDNTPDLPVPSAKWYFEHLQQSQYCLQIFKCNDVKCCCHRRTNYNEIFPTCFILAQVPFVNNESGIMSAAVGSGTGTNGSLFQRLALRRLEPARSQIQCNTI